VEREDLIRVSLTGNRLALDIEQAPDLVVQNRIVEME